MTKPEIGGIAPFFIVRNVPAAQSFYRDMFGCDITFEGPSPDDIYFGIAHRSAAMIMLKAVGGTASERQARCCAWLCALERLSVRLRSGHTGDRIFLAQRRVFAATQRRQGWIARIRGEGLRRLRAVLRPAERPDTGARSRLSVGDAPQIARRRDAELKRVQCAVVAHVSDVRAPWRYFVTSSRALSLACHASVARPSGSSIGAGGVVRSSRRRTARPAAAPAAMRHPAATKTSL